MLLTVDLTALSSAGDDCFRACINLATITLPTNTGFTFASNMFYGCAGLTTIDLSVYTNMVVLPAGMFVQCSNLQSVTLPNSLKKIGENAFYTCTDLETINLAKVEYIHYWSFNGCEALLTVDLTSLASPQGARCFEGCTKLTTISLPTNSGFAFAFGMFQDCKALATRIDMTRYTQMSTLPSNTFAGCSALTSITLPAQLETIERYAFADCGEVSVVHLKNVTKIGANAFSGCRGLPTINLGTVTSIGIDGFRGCTILSEADLRSWNWAEELFISVWG
jgi:hypothetical protein